MRAPITSGGQTGTVTITYTDGTKAVKTVDLLVDPAGYVFVSTDDGQQRLNGATVTIYQIINGQPVLWDGATFSQTNPQTTGPDGTFSFFVPAGTPLGLVPLLALIELISYFARAFSLGVLLFANIVAG